MVVGAGIAGLTCAHRIHRARPDVTLVVLDAGDAAGGKIRTTEIGGLAVDEAADAFLARGGVAIRLCEELGLADRLVSPAERRAFVFRHGALHRFPEAMVLGVPTDLDTLAATGLVSEAGIARAAADLTMPADGPDAPASGEDESVGALVRRRVGDEIFEAFVGPLLSGVNAGDADELSLAAGAPQLAAAVADQPSLIAGLRAQRAAALDTNPDPDAPVFHGLRGGTQTLTGALVDALPDGAVRTGVRVGALTTGNGCYELTTTSGPTGAIDTIAADAVVLATPSDATAALVEELDPGLADDLAALEWADVVMVTFVARRDDIDHPLDGSGFLVSDGEGLLMSACSFGSTKWAHWAPDAPGSPGERVVLRVSAGRHHDRRANELDDEALTKQLREELADVIGWHGDPVATRVSRWNCALPQYRPGHLERARAWKDRAATHPGLFLTGASYFGLGIPACITDATATAAAVVDQLAPISSKASKEQSP